MLIEDGTGSGKKAQVNIRNQLVTTSVALEDEIFVALEDSLAFTVDTGLLTIPASFSGPVLLIENLDSGRDLIIRSVKAVIDAVSTGSTFSVFRNPVLVQPLGASAVRAALNVNFESGIKANINSDVWDNATGLVGITGVTAVTDGTFGPTPFGGDGRLGGDIAILGQNDAVALNITSGAAGFECNVSVTLYFDTTGAK